MYGCMDVCMAVWLSVWLSVMIVLVGVTVPKLTYESKGDESIVL